MSIKLFRKLEFNMVKYSYKIAFSQKCNFRHVTILRVKFVFIFTACILRRLRDCPTYSAAQSTLSVR